MAIHQIFITISNCVSLYDPHPQWRSHARAQGDTCPRGIGETSVGPTNIITIILETDL